MEQHHQTLNVKDSKGDNHSVYGFANNTSNKLQNNAGYNTTLSKGFGVTITAVRACTDIPLATVSCSDWS